MTQVRKPRVLMADDHSIVLTGVRTLIEDRCEVVGTVENGRALVEAAERLRPDLILLDISMPLMNGLDAARQIKKLCPETKLIFLTMHTSPRFVTGAFKAGGNGYVLKHSASDELVQAIETVLNGHTYLTSAIVQPMLDHMQQSGQTKGVDDLTPRQREVLQLIGEGKGLKDIATLLNLSVKTVEFHKTCLMEQLNLHSQATLIRFAIAEGLVSAES